MKKKSVINILCSMVFAAGVLCSCNAPGNLKIRHDKNEKSLYEHGLELIKLMDEMVEDEIYLEVFTASDEIANIIESIAEGDYTEPSGVYEVKFSEEARNNMLTSLAPEVDLSQLSDELRDTLTRKISGTVVSQLNGMSGAKNLAAASICTAGKTFVCESIKDDVIYFYFFKETQPVAVSFSVGEDGAVSASATFVMLEEFLKDGSMNFAEYFSDMGAEITLLETE